MSGEAPKAGIRLGTVRDGVLVHEAGRDVTLSAPKSVSLAALVDGDKRVVRAHDEAVRATLEWIEEELLLTRQWDRERRRHRRVRAPGMVAAVFRHLANRNLDPQLHSHAVIANMTRTGEGEWRSLDLGALASNEMLIGAFYRNELAARVAALGYDLEPSRAGHVPSFEIRGYGRGCCGASRPAGGRSRSGSGSTAWRTRPRAASRRRWRRAGARRSRTARR